MPAGAPTPPDYLALAQYETQANRVNQYTPWGSSTWSQGGAPGGGGGGGGGGGATYDGYPVQMNQQGQAVAMGVNGFPNGYQISDPSKIQGNVVPGGDQPWTNTVSLNPEEQKALDSQFGIQAGLMGDAQGLLGRVGQDASVNPWSSGNLTPWASAPQASDQARQDAQSAAYDVQKQYLDPQWAQQDTATRDNLYSLGLKEGNPVFDKEMSREADSKARAYQAAQDSAVGQGQQAYGQSFQQSLQGGQFADTQRQQQIGEAGTQQNWDLAELQRMIQGMGVGSPSFGSVPSSADVVGAAAQGYQGAAQAAASQNQFWGNLASLAGVGLAPFTGGASLGLAAGGRFMSDERQKEFHDGPGDEMESFIRGGAPRKYNYKNPSAPGAAPGEHTGPTAQRLEHERGSRHLVQDTPAGKQVGYGQRDIGKIHSGLAYLNAKIDKKRSR